jgi:lipoic acid synthetase
VSRHLPVVSEGPSPAAEPVEPRRRHPRWLKVPMPAGAAYEELRRRVKELQLHTVCQSASCPNIGEC